MTNHQIAKHDFAEERLSNIPVIHRADMLVVQGHGVPIRKRASVISQKKLHLFCYSVGLFYELSFGYAFSQMTQSPK